MIFHEIEPEDGRWARPLLAAPGYASCEYAFVNIYMWQKVYNTQIARFEDFVIARNEGQHHIRYLYPPGQGDVVKVLDAILQDAQAENKTPVLFSLTEEAREMLESLYPGRFEYTRPRGESDYIYLAQELAELPGKIHQKKRNHCSRFERDNPGWQFHEITPDAMQAVCEFNNRWCNLYDNRGIEGIENEHRAIELACTHYNELLLKGGYITVNGEVVAFSFGSPLGTDMFVTHVEKALYDVSGAYSIINREIARNFCGCYTYINRENDVDDEGLRTAKLSYHPAWLEHKYVAEWKC